MLLTWLSSSHRWCNERTKTPFNVMLNGVFVILDVLVNEKSNY